MSHTVTQSSTHTLRHILRTFAYFENRPLFVADKVATKLTDFSCAKHLLVGYSLDQPVNPKLVVIPQGVLHQQFRPMHL